MSDMPVPDPTQGGPTTGQPDEQKRFLPVEAAFIAGSCAGILQIIIMSIFAILTLWTSPLETEFYHPFTVMAIIPGLSYCGVIFMMWRPRATTHFKAEKRRS